MQGEARMEIVDLSQEIYPGMPVFDGHPQVSMLPAVTHEQRQNIQNPTTVSPVVHHLHISEHTGTHVDAFNHFERQHYDRSIDTMPLEMFYTEGICLDLSHKGLLELIGIGDLKKALSKSGQQIKPKDTVLLYTDHYRRRWETEEWNDGPGITAEAAQWFGEQKISAFGVETRSPGVIGVSNKEVHTICGNMDYTHYENMVNLYKLVGRGRFRFIALPLKIRGGTGSPVRAIAVFE
jgi:kynurenine formamidase